MFLRVKKTPAQNPTTLGLQGPRRFRTQDIALSCLMMVSVLLGTLNLPNTAHAQMGDGTDNIVQRNRIVGRIYVPTRDPGDCNYMEHWYLYSSYIYPPAAPIKITPSARSYANLDEFLSAERRADPNGKHIKVFSEEEVGKCGF